MVVRSSRRAGSQMGCPAERLFGNLAGLLERAPFHVETTWAQKSCIGGFGRAAETEVEHLCFFVWYGK